LAPLGLSDFLFLFFADGASLVEDLVTIRIRDLKIFQPVIETMVVISELGLILSPPAMDVGKGLVFDCQKMLLAILKRDFRQKRRSFSIGPRFRWR
jgi:hypothetical protein